MQESGEMYLETILTLSQKKDSVRAIDVALAIGFSKSCVSRALARLKDEGCIAVEENGSITLTAKGREIGEKIYERHQILTKIIMLFGVAAETAVKDACRIEHVISDETYEALKKHLIEQHDTD